ncbi:penicillin acylase family protein [Gemmatimonadales bacterium]|nr:penicillin acylase family protein [Gemmatimonadales bacterium]
MKKLLIFFSLTLVACAPTDPQVAAWETMASEVTITRDDWGIAHVYGPTDAHAVFGAVFAQAEDDFHRIERNFLFSQGRLAEAYGEEELWGDLRMKLFINPTEIQAMYDESPQWLKKLMDGWADGLNYYLHTHPETEPMVLDRFEPWMALTFSEGSIGGDIERVNTRQLEAFYDEGPEGTAMAQLDLEEPLIDWEEPRGSNGIAISPKNTVNGNALLLINPHTSFFFRSELHMRSDEGLNAYGASTWGQFFIYQGFNEDAGWMHTSSGVDNIDEYLETITQQDGQYSYIVDGEERPVQTREITVPFLTQEGMDSRTFTTFRTHHGPVVRAQDGKWVTTALMEEPLSALIQSWDRTKRTDLSGYRENMSMHTNSSNNTVYADSEGNVAYWHSNFIPKRRTDIDWTQPVDGSISTNDWGDPHSVDETPNVFNPSVGWIQNTNNWPYSAAGPDSPRKSDYPAYFQRSGENARGIHAIRILENRSDFTLEKLLEAAYSTQIPGFEPIIPALIRAYDGAPVSSSFRSQLSEQIETLRDWDYRWDVESVATSLATYWAEDMMQRVAQAAQNASVPVATYIAQLATREEHLEALNAATDLLIDEFGDWRTPWGDINRFQRINGDIQQPFSDTEPSIPVGFHSGRWGSLASFGARRYPGTVRRYGTSGNSFVAVVEFGERVTALAITAGGESGDPDSPHFNDQAERYSQGDLRPVYFYPEDILEHAEETYMPGNR